jgi:hypothetical protein
MTTNSALSATISYLCWPSFPHSSTPEFGHPTIASATVSHSTDQRYGTDIRKSGTKYEATPHPELSSFPSSKSELQISRKSTTRHIFSLSLPPSACFVFYKFITMPKKRVLVGYGVDIDAVAGWLGSYGGEDSSSDISRGTVFSPLPPYPLFLNPHSRPLRRHHRRPPPPQALRKE